MEFGYAIVERVDSGGGEARKIRWDSEEAVPCAEETRDLH